MTLSLLQISYIQEGDPTVGIIVFICLGIGIAILVALNIAKNGIGSMRSGGIKTGASRHFSKWALRRAAANYGLNGPQTKLLETIFRRAQVSDPETALANLETLDRHFKRIYHEIEANAESESDAEERKAILFSIRSRVEAARGGGPRIGSTRRLPDGMAATLTNSQNETFPVRILSTKGQSILIEAPKNALGVTLRFPRGSKLLLSFYARGNQGYRFDTRVYGNRETARGSTIEVAHSDHVVSLPNRRFKRTSTSLACVFSSVRLEQRTVGRKVEKKTIVDDRRSAGTIMDLSLGGCSIKSAVPLSAGSYIKIEFDDMHDRSVAALGRIVRTNKAGAVSGVMHIQFVKTPRRAFNAVSATVYGYDKD